MNAHPNLAVEFKDVDIIFGSRAKEAQERLAARARQRSTKSGRSKP